MGQSAYGDKFFEDRSDSMNSAKIVVPVVLSLIKPESIVDVGCGTGDWLHVFMEHGVSDILGVDADWVKREYLRIPEKCFLPADLEKPLNITRKFDLVITLEVAEHICAGSAQSFVDSLTSLAPVVLFSAAIPFQGGTSHVNEQWPDYWAGLFRKRGYVPVDCIRSKIWNDKRIEFWYRQNILLFVKEDYLDSHPILKAESEKSKNACLSVVHPEIYIRKYELIAKLIPFRVKKLIMNLMAGNK